MIATLSDGRWGVAWPSEGQDGDGSQLYNADGTPQGSEVPVNTFSTSGQISPRIVGLANGGRVVNWQSDGRDGDNYSIFTQAYAADGPPRGDEIQVNTFTDSLQIEPAIEDGGTLSYQYAWSVDGTPISVTETHSFVLGPEHAGTVIGVFAKVEGYTGIDLSGTSSRDVLQSTQDNDQLCGLAGDDTRVGSLGRDLLIGGRASDRLMGGGRPDKLKGGGGDDLLLGGSKADIFAFGDGYGDDSIGDFEDGLDTFRITSGAASFGDLTISQSEDDVLISFATTTALVTNASVGDFTNADLSFCSSWSTIRARGANHELSLGSVRGLLNLAHQADAVSSAPIWTRHRSTCRANIHPRAYILFHS